MFGSITAIIGEAVRSPAGSYILDGASATRPLVNATVGSHASTGQILPRCNPLIQMISRPSRLSMIRAFR